MSDTNPVCSEFQGKRILFVAETPFQVFGAVSIATILARQTTCDMTLLVGTRVPRVERYVDKIRNSGLFSCVEATGGRSQRSSRQGLEYLLTEIFRSDRSDRRLEFVSVCGDAGNCYYDYLFCTGVTTLTIDARRYLVPQGRTWFYDDGSGSHTGEIFTSLLFFDNDVLSENFQWSRSARLKRTIKRFVSGFKDLRQHCYRIKGLWLFGATDVDRKNYSPHIEIIDIPSHFDANLVEEIFFQGDPTPYGEARYIYLTLPDRVGKEVIRKENELIGSLNSVLSGALRVRPHPARSTVELERLGVSLLSNEISWEALVATGCITSDHVLIAAASTAQATPRQLAGTQPFVIFTYPVLAASGLPSAPLEAVDRSVRSLYGDERVMTAMTANHLAALLSSIGGEFS